MLDVVALLVAVVLALGTGFVLTVPTGARREDDDR